MQHFEHPKPQEWPRNLVSLPEVNTNELLFASGGRAVRHK